MVACRRVSSFEMDGISKIHSFKVVVNKWSKLNDQMSPEIRKFPTVASLLAVDCRPYSGAGTVL